MVHALGQIRRVLKPGGTLIDIRPDRFGDPQQPHPALPAVCWCSDRREMPAGTLEKTAQNLRRHRAATQALHRVVGRGAFVLESTETFPFRYYFRGLPTLDAFLKLRWISSRLSGRVRRRLTLLQRTAPRGKIVVVEPVRLNVLRKA